MGSEIYVQKSTGSSFKVPLTQQLGTTYIIPKRQSRDNGNIRYTNKQDTHTDPHSPDGTCNIPQIVVGTEMGELRLTLT